MIQEIFSLKSSGKLLDSIYDSVVITDGKLEGPDHPKILYVNRAFEKITGYSANEVIGKTPRILQGEKTQREVLDHLKKTLLKGEFFEGDTVNYKKDGTPYHVEWNITPVEDDAGTVVNYFCIQKDITQSVEYKEFLKHKAQKEKEKRKDQDLVIQKQAKMAAMGEMIDAIAHQWKQPIGVIKLRLDMLRYDLEDAEDPIDAYEEAHEKINFQFKHMENTLNEFRGFLRTDKKLKSFYTKDLIDKVLLLTKDEYMKHQIEISLDIDPKQYICGYENEFKHVVLNILNNARDALVQNNISSKKIKISSFNRNEINFLSIQDNAGGIDEQKLPLIFEPEFTTKSSDKGSGIGLYMSRQILDKFNAIIKANNQNGGVCFTIEWVNTCDL